MKYPNDLVKYEIEAHRTVAKHSKNTIEIAKKCIHDMGKELNKALDLEDKGLDYTPKYQEILRDYAIEADCDPREFDNLVEALTTLGALPYC